MANVPRTQRDLVKLAVLSMLAEEPRHPYEMLRLIRDRHKDFVIGLPRSLYHAVDRLLEEELIVPVETSRTGRRPERTVYTVTDEGLEEFVAWMSDLIAFPRDEAPMFTAAISLWAGLPPEGVLARLRIRAAALEGKVVAIDAQLRAIQPVLPRVVLMETEYACALLRAELDWVQNVIDDIATGRLVWDSSTARRIVAEKILDLTLPSDTLEGRRDG
jgi:DNA-binding PadR family transcriptional regulator